MDDFDFKKKKTLTSLHGIFVERCTKKFRFSTADYDKLREISAKPFPSDSVIHTEQAIRKIYAEAIAKTFNCSDVRARELVNAAELIHKETIFINNLSKRTNRETISPAIGDYEDFMMEHGLTGNPESETKTGDPEKNNVVPLFPESNKK
ncbi:MAG: hypothetical protein WC526_04560 [Patescibacteria group bacterium]